MTAPIDIRPVDLAIVQDTLRAVLPATARVYVFGSRALWTTKDGSDLDLAIDAGRKLSREESVDLADAFEESDLPYKVDVVDLHDVSDGFRAIVERDRVVLGWGKPRDWRQSTWGDEISLEYGKGIRGYADAKGPYRVFGSNGPVGWATEPLTHGPGIILGRKGAYRGVRFSKEPFHVIDTAYYVVPKTEMDMQWLYYSIIYHKLGEIDDGSPIPSTTRAAVYVRELDVPDLSEQTAIASVLAALDDKIELNRAMNETLEAMARAIFKDWFVDFGPTRAKIHGQAPYLPPEIWSLFPDTLDDEGKPEGWAESTARSLTHRITKGTTPTSKQIEAALDVTSVNFLRVNNLSEDGKLLLGNTVRIAQSLHEGVLRRSMLEKDDLLYSIAGTIGRVAKTPQSVLPANVNQAIAIVRPNPELAPPNYLWLWFSDAGFQNSLHSKVVQAVQANLSLGILSDARILVPPRKILSCLLRPIDALLEKRANNEAESQTLAATRDFFLPKLMSGEVRVTDGETMIEGVV